MTTRVSVFITTCETTCVNSTKLPGQRYARSVASASSVNSSCLGSNFGFEERLAISFSSAGMSSGRSRKRRQLHGQRGDAVEKLFVELALLGKVFRGPPRSRRSGGRCGRCCATPTRVRPALPCGGIAGEAGKACRRGLARTHVPP